MGKAQDHKAVWNNIIRSAQAEPREAELIRGVSGLEHPIRAIGIDEDRRRLVIICQEIDARSAALLQSDIQAAYRSLKVIVARPILVSISNAAQAVLTDTDTAEHSESDRWKTAYYRVLGQLARQSFDFPDSTVSPNELIGLAGFFSHFSSMAEVMKEFGMLDEDREPGAKLTKEEEIRCLSQLLKKDPVYEDQQLGICPIPLFDFSLDELELFKSAVDVEAVTEVLREHDLLQYFFPAPDTLALGLIDRETIKDSSQLASQILEAPRIGHPFGPAEIVHTETPVLDMIDALRERGLVVEGELGLELTPEGESKRRVIKFKPREGFLSKLINRFSFNIDLKDLFRS